jgi:hypothetical protein
MTPLPSTGQTTKTMEGVNLARNQHDDTECYYITSNPIRNTYRITHSGLI